MKKNSCRFMEALLADEPNPPHSPIDFIAAYLAFLDECVEGKWVDQGIHPVWSTARKSRSILLRIRSYCAIANQNPTMRSLWKTLEGASRHVLESVP